MRGEGPYAGEELKALVGSGATLAEMAASLGRSVGSVRYWLDRHKIEVTNPRGPRRRCSDGAKPAIFECRQHGLTEFTLEGRGHYRCKRCRSRAVINRRRIIKEKLVEEAGGACALCGYARCDRSPAVPPRRSQPQDVQHQSAWAFALPCPKSRAEARKCVLLCANCHAEVEGGFATLPVELRDMPDSSINST